MEINPLVNDIQVGKLPNQNKHYQRAIKLLKLHSEDKDSVVFIQLANDFSTKKSLLEFLYNEYNILYEVRNGSIDEIDNVDNEEVNYAFIIKERLKVNLNLSRKNE